MDDEGIDPSGQTVSVPQYQHKTTLDFTRFELTPEYSFADNWDLKLRVPYDIKKRKSSIGLLGPANPSEIDAMQRDSDYHHPTKTLQGFSDFQLLATHYLPNTFFDRDSLTLSAGLTLPVGKTEANPYTLGNLGLRHEHIQFGTGTFNPLIEISYSAPILDNLRGGLFASSRLPLYENNRGYQGSKEINLGAQLSYMLDTKWSIHSSAIYAHEGFAHWDGVRDENTGSERLNGLVGAGYNLGHGVFLSLDYLFPISQRSLVSGGDSYRQGKIFLVNTSISF